MVDVCFSNAINDVYSTHPIQVDIEDRVDQRRFSNATLECSEHIVESINEK